MTTQTLTITDFLLARIAEDERDARDYGDDDSPGTWRHYGESVSAAHRRIVEECKAWSDEWAAENLGGHVLRHLAAVYADHPDHRDEWRP